MKQKALVVGLGASGEACSRFLLKRDWSVISTDTRQRPPALSRLNGVQGFEFCSLDEALNKLGGVELLVMSPGISPWHSAVTPLVQKALSMGIEMVGEIELFARELNRLEELRGYKPKVIGAWGASGKKW